MAKEKETKKKKGGLKPLLLLAILIALLAYAKKTGFWEKKPWENVPFLPESVKEDMGYSSNYSAEHYAAIVPYKDGKAQTPIEALDSGSANVAAIYTVEEGLSGLCGLFTYKNPDNKASLSVVIIYQLAD